MFYYEIFLTPDKLMVPCFTDFMQFQVHVPSYFNNSIAMLFSHNSEHTHTHIHTYIYAQTHMSRILNSCFMN